MNCDECDKESDEDYSCGHKYYCEQCHTMYTNHNSLDYKLSSMHHLGHCIYCIMLGYHNPIDCWDEVDHLFALFDIGVEEGKTKSIPFIDTDDYDKLNVIDDHDIVYYDNIEFTKVYMKGFEIGRQLKTYTKNAYD